MLRVLVVDDKFSNRQLLVAFLANKAVCDAAVNGHEAFEAYQLSVENNKPYDVILLDIEMPEMNGLEFLDALREDEKKRGVILGEGVPIIMVTAHEESFMKAFNDGCDDYIIKPIDPQLLFQKIGKLLSERRRPGT
jgi:two-component system chemotaxis response regulator CheY